MKLEGIALLSSALEHEIEMKTKVIGTQQVWMSLGRSLLLPAASLLISKSEKSDKRYRVRR